ncbi:hypothetical protein [Microvirga mediterraneensis]|uniref:Uncharacterized protein n=1 Tax=Microvirga mediterraneensis TaxID=2754695 RepID=A0A838BXR6_9HYPH|nr:hypothetical protein [Microvirga mediterraneensis]MBA1159366.1 hypothetical protein [Microvirga mediterraneensis]
MTMNDLAERIEELRDRGSWSRIGFLVIDNLDAILTALRSADKSEKGDQILVAENAAGVVRAMMRIDGDDCQSIAETLLEWHETDPNRKLRIVHSAMLQAPPVQEDAR